jgi:hypothetical protein
MRRLFGPSSRLSLIRVSVTGSRLWGQLLEAFLEGVLKDLQAGGWRC